MSLKEEYMCPGGSWGVCVLGEGERKLLKKYVLGAGGVYWMSWGGGGRGGNNR